MSTRIDLLTALDELDSVLEDALVDNAHVVLRRSRARMQAWYDWMFPVPDDDQLAYGSPIAYHLGDETVYERWWDHNVGAGRPTGDEPTHADECWVEDSTGVIVHCHEDQVKVGLVYNVVAGEPYESITYGCPMVTHAFKYLGKYSATPLKSKYEYDAVESEYESRPRGEREMDHDGVYI